MTTKYPFESIISLLEFAQFQHGEQTINEDGSMHYTNHLKYQIEYQIEYSYQMETDMVRMIVMNGPPDGTIFLPHISFDHFLTLLKGLHKISHIYQDRSHTPRQREVSGYLHENIVTIERNITIYYNIYDSWNNLVNLLEIINRVKEELPSLTDDKKPN